jgi:MFS family permease
MERVWASRLRWRLRGAWLAPLLVALTLLDALLLHWRPLAGDGQTQFFAALLLASFLNLVAVAALAPLVAAVVRRVRRDQPVVVARNRAGVALVLLVTAGLLAGGLLHHGTVVRDTRSLADAHVRAIAWIGAYAPAAFRRHVALAETVAVVPGRVFRTCAPDPASGRAWCVVVRTHGGIRRDGGTPNAAFQAGRE